MEINNYTIKLINGKQPSYKPVYSLELVKLKILKIYIKTNLANVFIKFFKSFINALILIIQKLNGSFYLYINYGDLNN